MGLRGKTPAEMAGILRDFGRNRLLGLIFLRFVLGSTNSELQYATNAHFTPDEGKWVRGGQVHWTRCETEETLCSSQTGERATQVQVEYNIPFN